jgi:hypothetical protein
LEGETPVESDTKPFHASIGSQLALTQSRKALLDWFGCDGTQGSAVCMAEVDMAETIHQYLLPSLPLDIGLVFPAAIEAAASNPDVLTYDQAMAEPKQHCTSQVD